MKPIAIVGIVLLVLGIGALAYQGITYKSRETIVDLGPLQATAVTKKTLPLPPVLGGGLALAGVALLLVGVRKRA